MSHDFFAFKQFTVRQSMAAMKVGEDGVLLGAWTNVLQAKRILDVGTGTGLLALMLAQRQPSAQIDAVDIDAAACMQARQNIADSPWKERISVVCDDFGHFARYSAARYDLIVSNPPYFSHSLKSPDRQRSLARHADSLSLSVLTDGAARLLSADGKIAVVLPATEARAWAEKYLSLGWSACRMLHVRTTPSKPFSRLLLELSRTETSLTENKLTVKNGTDSFTDEYKALTRAFYLKF
ncbi:MAG: methyltransferase [Bacteroidales bacterium]|jgi:tRNA1Val (adenine37-N6)-methyltransferase|nr:methyltransferase [Bacteroidales bacterium]